MNMKAFAILAGVVMMLCMMLAVRGSRLAATESRIEASPTKARTKSDFYGPILRTIEHDGHSFVVVDGDAILHHPDCSCTSLK
jgi:hypothetical protein